MIVYYILTGVCGLIIGSFLSVLISRYGAKTIIYGRSRCGSCGRTLGFFDLVPLFSFLYMRGKCRMCGSRISRRYIVLEILTALVFVSITYHIHTLGPVLAGSFVWLFLLYAIAWSALIALAFYDLDHFIIPDGLVAVFIVAGYAARIMELSVEQMPFTYLTLISGVILAAPFLFFWIISRGTWLGFGDIKLIFGIGGMLGIISGTSAVILGIWFGAAISLILIATKSFALVRIRKQLTMKSEVAFGPYLVLGTYTAFMFLPDVLNLSVFLYDTIFI